jgi:hypothetical protein
VPKARRTTRIDLERRFGVSTPTHFGDVKMNDIKTLIAIAATALPLMALGCGSSSGTTEQTEEDPPPETTGNEDISAEEDAGVSEEEGDLEEESDAP